MKGKGKDYFPPCFLHTFISLLHMTWREILPSSHLHNIKGVSFDTLESWVMDQIESVSLSLHYSGGWTFSLRVALVCCRNSGAPGSGSMLEAAVLRTFLFPITVPFRPKLTAGEGTRKLVAKTMRWVVRWHVARFRCKRETCLVSARRSLAPSHSWFLIFFLPITL
jgi:hypothetical protein